jgi:transcriptional regulator with XRE-family HTH domain
VRRTDDFGAALRAFRERLTPRVAGIEPVRSESRRVPGLRRDELAQLAGVSEEHLKRLEQGRRHPSSGTVDALAKALRLDPGEHEQLSLLAGFATPYRRQIVGQDRSEAPFPARIPREITAPARRMLGLPNVPVCVCDASWTVLAGNHQWTYLLCKRDISGLYGSNVAWRLFTEMPTRVTRSGEYQSNFKASVVASLRSAVLRYPGDPQLRDLVADLRAVSEDFAARWSAPEPAGHHPDRVTVDHPDLGPLRLDKDVLLVEPGDLRVVVFTVPAAADRQEPVSTGSM